MRRVVLLLHCPSMHYRLSLSTPAISAIQVSFIIFDENVMPKKANITSANIIFTPIQVSKVIWQKAASPIVTSRGCESIRPILTPSIGLHGLLEPHMSQPPHDISTGSLILYILLVCLRHRQVLDYKHQFKSRRLHFMLPGQEFGTVCLHKFVNLICHLTVFNGRWRGLLLFKAPAPSDLFLSAVYKFAYLLT